MRGSGVQQQAILYGVTPARVAALMEPMLQNIEPAHVILSENTLNNWDVAEAKEGLYFAIDDKGSQLGPFSSFEEGCAYLLEQEVDLDVESIGDVIITQAAPDEYELRVENDREAEIIGPIDSLGEARAAALELAKERQLRTAQKALSC